MPSESINPQDILYALRWRYATKKYDPARKIPADTWQTLEHAILLAPSSYGLQPWKALVITDPALRAKLRPAAHGQSQVTDASHLVIFAAHKTITADYVDRFIQRVADVRGVTPEILKTYRDTMIGDVVTGPRSSIAQSWAQRQSYIALGFLLEAAALLHIDASPMEGFDPTQFDQILNLAPQNLTATAMCALGYRAANDTYATFPKVRLPQTEIIQHL